ncbi:MAG: hypothetical protein ACX98W_16805 [bacterium]
MPRAKGSVAKRSVGLGLLVGLLGLPGCTTLPFMPKSGAGSAVTIATAEYVASQNESLRGELLDELEARVAAQVRSAREEDRARIATIADRIESLADRVDARAEEVAGLVDRVDRSDRALEEIATMLAERLDRLADESAELRRTATGLEEDLRVVPVETLDRLRRAIEVDLRGDLRDGLQGDLRRDEAATRVERPREPDEPTENEASSRVSPVGAEGRSAGQRTERPPDR